MTDSTKTKSIPGVGETKGIVNLTVLKKKMGKIYLVLLS